MWPFVNRATIQICVDNLYTIRPFLVFSELHIVCHICAQIFASKCSCYNMYMYVHWRILLGTIPGRGSVFQRWKNKISKAFSAKQTIEALIFQQYMAQYLNMAQSISSGPYLHVCHAPPLCMSLFCFLLFKLQDAYFQHGVRAQLVAKNLHSKTPPFVLLTYAYIWPDPNIMKKFQVDRGAIKFVLSGANIMCPGLTSPGGVLDNEVEEETPVVQD